MKICEGGKTSENLVVMLIKLFYDCCFVKVKSASCLLLLTLHIAVFNFHFAVRSCRSKSICGFHFQSFSQFSSNLNSKFLEAIKTCGCCGLGWHVKEVYRFLPLDIWVEKNFLFIEELSTSLKLLSKSIRSLVRLKPQKVAEEFLLKFPSNLFIKSFFEQLNLNFMQIVEQFKELTKFMEHFFLHETRITF